MSWFIWQDGLHRQCDESAVSHWQQAFPAYEFRLVASVYYGTGFAQLEARPLQSGDATTAQRPEPTAP